MYPLNHYLRVVVILPISPAWSNLTRLTENDLAAIEYTNHLIPRRLVMVNLQQFYSSARHRTRYGEDDRPC